MQASAADRVLCATRPEHLPCKLPGLQSGVTQGGHVLLVVFRQLYESRVVTFFVAEGALETHILARAGYLVVYIAVRVPDVVPEEPADEGGAADFVQNIVVDEPVLKRLPLHHGGGRVIPDVEAARDLKE